MTSLTNTGLVVTSLLTAALLPSCGSASRAAPDPGVAEEPPSLPQGGQPEPVSTPAQPKKEDAGAAFAPGASPAGPFRCPSGPFAAPVGPGTAAARIAGLPPSDAFNASGATRTNVEGAVWSGDALYVSEFPFTETPPSRVLKLDATGAVTVALTDLGSNGLAIDKAGNLVFGNHKDGALSRVPIAGGTPTHLARSYEKRRFNSPNDLAIRSDGNIYFSDPTWQAPSPPPQSKARVYRLAPGASEVTVVAEDRSEPNGVTLSADERTLYVSGMDGVFSYPVAANGSVGAGKRLGGFSGQADGLGMDCAGNLYVTAGKRVAVLSPAGAEIASIAVPQAESVTNVAFGGTDRQTLFITSMGVGNARGLFQTRVGIPGLPY